MLKAIGAMISGAVIALGASSSASAFDTGPHASLTEQAMTLAGYGRPAADVVQVENWLTDYYTSSPTLPASQQCYLEKLHFDDVFGDADVDAYWNTLLRNTLAAAQKAKDDNDVVEFYAVLGVSLHVVQDFYAHSNWAESTLPPSAGFDTTTYFQWRAHPFKRTDVLHTGWYPNCLNIPQGAHTPHGGYASGMNHDSVVRPNFDRAYVYALAASTEWLDQVTSLMLRSPDGPKFLERAQNWRPTPVDAAALARDQQASLYLSEWIQNPLDTAALDGHWNGNHSGYAAAFVAFAATWTASPDSPFVAAFKHDAPYVALSQGLYEPFAGAAPVAALSPLGGSFLRLSVARVCARVGLGTESYFGRLTAQSRDVSDYPSRDAALIHRSCGDVPWRHLVWVSSLAKSISLTYGLGDETGLPTPGEKAVPIDGDATALVFRCALPASGKSGCTWGVADGPQRPMPVSLDTQGAWGSGASLDGVSIAITPASPRP